MISSRLPICLLLALGLHLSSAELDKDACPSGTTERVLACLQPFGNERVIDIADGLQNNDATAMLTPLCDAEEDVNYETMNGCLNCMRRELLVCNQSESFILMLTNIQPDDVYSGCFYKKDCPTVIDAIQNATVCSMGVSKVPGPNAAVCQAANDACTCIKENGIKNCEIAYQSNLFVDQIRGVYGVLDMRGIPCADLRACRDAVEAAEDIRTKYNITTTTTTTPDYSNMSFTSPMTTTTIPTTTPDNDVDDNTDGASSRAVIIGVSCGAALVVVAAIVCLAVYCCRRSRDDDHNTVIPGATKSADFESKLYTQHTIPDSKHTQEKSFGNTSYQDVVFKAQGGMY